MERKSEAKQKRREATESRLVAAVGQVLEKGGMKSLGINAVAEMAETDKVLIYRYFGDLSGLLRHYGESADFWPTLDEMLGCQREVLEEKDLARLVTELLGRFAQALRSRPVTLDLLAWECVERSPLTIVLEEVRERRYEELYAALEQAGHEIPPLLSGLTALLGASINYLAIRSRGISTFSGLPIGRDEDWEQIGQIIEAVARSIVPNKSKTHQVGKRKRTSG